jgi:hypothetical protein
MAVNRNNAFVVTGNTIFDPNELDALRAEIGKMMKPTPEKAEVIKWCEGRKKYLERTLTYCGISVPMKKEESLVVATTPDHMEYLLTEGYLPIRDRK